MTPVRLVAPGGLAVSVEDGVVRVEFGTPDWLGPGAFSVAGQRQPLTSATRTENTLVALEEGPVRLTIHAPADETLIIFRMEARAALEDLATGAFANPSYAWPAFAPSLREPGGLPEGSRGFGYQYTEFAWPTQSDASLAKWRLLPFRPPVVEPLGVIAPDGRCLLLGPLNAFHDQVISVEDGIVCGWHGDVERVPQGFATEMALVGGAGARDCLDRYGALLRERNGTRRPRREADELGRTVSYWTDNGSAYWYRTEPGADTTTTLQSTLADLRDRNIAVGAVQLDSWWYPHEVVRPFNTDDWVVPPTGLVRWEPRDDVLPDGVRGLRDALGHPPLVTHCRHLSSSSPYVDEHDCWVDGDRAHPKGADLYERWLDQAQAWGVETFEHDWLVESFLGVRGLRAEPGRAREWQEGIDRAAAARGMTLQWCMATPADFLQSTTLRSLTSIRTSGDHGYLIGPGELWAWFLLTNALARSLHLRPYKDVFRSDRADRAHHAEVEALLSALSSGPVGIGDELARADRDIVLRTCRDDGTLVQPDVALAAVDRCFSEHPVARAVPLVAEAWTDHAAGRWVYAVTLNVSRFDQRIEGNVELSTLGASTPAGPVACWDWRTGTVSRLEASSGWRIALDPLDWDLRVLAPILPGGLAVIGDPSRYATAGDSRLESVDAQDGGVRFTVLGAGELVSIVGWADHPPRVGANVTLEWHDPLWRVWARVPETGRLSVDVV
ncbi:MAG: hypothetical protein QOH79_3676 [Acidimicrobiaceae bacterium]